MSQTIAIFKGDIVRCSWCKEALGQYPTINADNLKQHDHYIKGLCEVLFDEEIAIDEWRTERMFDPTASE